MKNRLYLSKDKCFFSKAKGGTATEGLVQQHLPKSGDFPIYRD